VIKIFTLLMGHAHMVTALGDRFAKPHLASRQEKRRSRGAATEMWRRCYRLTPLHESVAPSRGLWSICRPYPGLTPQAKNMPRLRRSNQGVTPEGLHGSSTSGANLFQDETGGRILHLVTCTLYLGGREGLAPYS